MKKQILLGLGALIVIGVLLGVALALAAPNPLPAADAQTFATANQLNEKGQYAAAVNLYEQLLAKGIENADVYYNLGRAQAALNDNDGASESFTRAQQLAPRDAEIAQAAGTSGGLSIPLTEDEIAVGLLILMCVVAALFILARHRDGKSAVAA